MTVSPSIYSSISPSIHFTVYTQLLLSARYYPGFKHFRMNEIEKVTVSSSSPVVLGKSAVGRDKLFLK